MMIQSLNEYKGKLLKNKPYVTANEVEELKIQEVIALSLKEAEGSSNQDSSTTSSNYGLELSEQVLPSSMILKIHENDIIFKFFGPLSKYIVSKIAEYLSYKEIMTKMRYLNLSFLHLTTNLIQYFPSIEKYALMKVNLTKVFMGESMMPIITHPYYKNCETLKIIYDVGEAPKEYEGMFEEFFMRALFESKELFPNIKSLDIHHILR